MGRLQALSLGLLAFVLSAQAKVVTLTSTGRTSRFASSILRHEDFTDLM